MRTYDPNLQIIWLMTRCLHYSTVFTIYIEAQRSRKLQLDASSACHTLYYFSMTFYGNVFVVSSVVFVPLQFSSSQVPIPVGENCWSTCLTLRVLNLLDVVPWEGTEGAGTIAGTDVPSVVALFQHVHRVAFEQLQLVVVLGEVLEHGAVSARRDTAVPRNGTNYKHFNCCISNRVVSGLLVKEMTCNLSYQCGPK